MITKPLIFVATPDLAGKMRGKSFPLEDLDRRSERGVGWTPSILQITCFDSIELSAFGTLGDVLLVPDPSTAVEVDFGDGSRAESFVLGDLRTLEGEPWPYCSRSILRTALERLKRVGGVDLVAAFEHEFQFKHAAAPPGDAYSLAGFRRRGDFCETLAAALDTAELKVDTIQKEYGPSQYEVTICPEPGLRAADAASILRELTRVTAGRFGEKVTFTPLQEPETIGNGVHIHMSFLDPAGAPVTDDRNRPAGLSDLAGSFIAGILAHLDSIVALTAPSGISCMRLTPHRWSAAFNNLGLQDREASVRICPVAGRDPESVARQYNFEFRAADAAASPHLALAAIVHAGAQGIEDDLPSPPITEEDLSLLSEAELAARGYTRLPQSLEAALDRFESNPVARSWFAGDFPEVYLAHKRCELAFLDGKDAAARCAAYAEVY